MMWYWYLTIYVSVMFLIMTVPAIVGAEWAKDEPGKTFGTALLWPIAGPIFVGVVIIVGIGEGFEQLGKLYSRFVEHMHNYWQERAKAKSQPEVVGVSLNDYVEQQEKMDMDYRHMNCKECGKPLNEV